MTALATIHSGANHATVETPYHDAIVAQFKALPGCRWDPARKVWEGPPEAVAEVIGTLKRAGVIVTSGEIPNQIMIGDVTDYGNADLYQYQRSAVHTMQNCFEKRGAALLADDMGLGKTVQTLRALLKAPTPILVLSPAIMVHKWLEEAKRWNGWEGDVLGRKLSKKQGGGRVLAHERLLVGSYDTFRTLTKNLPEVPTLVLDELHYLSSPKALRTRAVKSYVARCRTRFPWFAVVGLTGTPMTARPRDLWQPLDLLYPGRFGTKWQFERRYCTPAETPIWMGDFTFKPISQVRVGDEVIGWQPTLFDPNGYQQKRLCRTKVTAIHQHVDSVITAVMESGRSIRCTADHLWMAYNDQHNSAQGTTRWVSVSRRSVLSHIVDIPTELRKDQLLDAGWLAGMYDGEGTGTGIAQSRSHNPELCNELDRVMTALGLPHNSRGDRQYLLGGRQTLVNFVNWCRPRKVTRHLVDKILTSRLKTRDKVAEIKPATGLETVYGLTTETGNYVAWGYASKNCDGKMVEVRGLEEPVWDAGGRSNLEELGRRLRYDNLMIRRTKGEVLELPAYQRITLPVELPPKARKALAAATVSLSADKDVQRVLSVIEEHKLNAALELADDLRQQGRRPLLFTLRKETARQLGEKLGAPVVTGEDEPGTRAGKLKGAECGVATIYSVTTGIDLVGFDCAIFVGLDWVPSTLLQAEARLHRIGQESGVTFYYLIGLGTLDEVVRAKVIERLEDFATVVGKAENEAGLASALRGAKSEAELLDEIVASIMEAA